MSCTVELLNLLAVDLVSSDVLAPIGISYIAAALQDAGISASTAFHQTGVDDTSLIQRLRKDPPLILGLSATGREIPGMKRFVAKVKSALPSLPIVVGGYCSMAGADLFTDSAIDVVVLGEGEQTMIDLARRFISRSPLEDVPGIIYREGSRIQRTKARPALNDLDLLPPPRYTHRPARTHLLRIYAARGCPYDCTFCRIKDFYGQTKIRYHSAAYVKALVKEIAPLAGTDVRYIYFNDDEFLLDPDHLRRMAQVGRDLGMTICFETRTPDIIRHAAVLAEERDAIHQVHMGVESFSQTQLDRWSKRVSVKANREALEILSELNISYIPYLLLADHRTTVEELEETCAGMVAMPRSPYPVRSRGVELRPRLSPLHIGVPASRMHDFHGNMVRDPSTNYLEGVWSFVGGIDKEMRALARACLHARAQICLQPETAPVRADEVVAMESLLEARISRLPEIAARARCLQSTEEIMELGRREATAFVEASRKVRIGCLAALAMAECAGFRQSERVPCAG